MRSYAKLVIDHCPECIATERAVVDIPDVKMLHLHMEITHNPSRLDTEHPIPRCVIECRNKWESVDTLNRRKYGPCPCRGSSIGRVLD